MCILLRFSFSSIFHKTMSAELGSIFVKFCIICKILQKWIYSYALTPLTVFNMKAFYRIFINIRKVWILSGFSFSSIFHKITGVEHCPVLSNFAYMHILWLPDSSYSFQASSFFLFYRRFFTYTKGVHTVEFVYNEVQGTLDLSSL